MWKSSRGVQEACSSVNELQASALPKDMFCKVPIAGTTGNRTLRVKVYMRLVFKLILIIVLLQEGTSSAGDIVPFANRDGTIGLYKEGRLENKDVVQLRYLLQTAAEQRQKITTLVLNSKGGDPNVGYALAIEVRKAGLNTYVREGETCASACFIPFAAGIERYASSNAHVGVHSVSEDDGRETKLAKASTTDMARFLKALGVLPHIIGLAVGTPPDDIAWLSQEDLKYMGVNVVAPSQEDRKYLIEVAPLVEPQGVRSTAPTAKDRKQARALNEKGRKLILQNKAAEAIPILMKAALTYPFDAEISGNLGFAMYRSGQFTNARDTLNLSLKVNRERWVTWGNLAMTVAELGEIDWATECLLNYVQFSGNNSSKAMTQLRSWARVNSSLPRLIGPATAAIQRLGIGTSK